LSNINRFARSFLYVLSADEPPIEFTSAARTLGKWNLSRDILAPSVVDQSTVSATLVGRHGSHLLPTIY